MKSKKLFLIVSCTTLLTACVDTDVVDELLVPERVSINTRLQSIAVGESYQLMAEFFNRFGEMEASMISWSSSNPEVISVDDTGLAEAIMPGSVRIRASYNGAADSIDVAAASETQVGNNQRMGRFMGVNDYSVNGQFVLEEVDDKLRLTFLQNFSSSNGPGLFVFLSNNERSVIGGFEMGRLKSNSGMQVYETSIDNVRLFSYNHVLVYCKPFGAVFGAGRLEN